LIWLTGRLAPDFKTIADFRKDNGPAIRPTCRRFIEVCRRLNLFAHTVTAIDGSKFRVVNAAHGKNLTCAKLQKRMDQVKARIERYLAALEKRRTVRKASFGSQVGAAEGQDRVPARPDAQVQGA
jgi:hypothetical protein